MGTRPDTGLLVTTKTKGKIMKKLALTSLLALFAVSSANAATNYFVGGSVGIATTDADDTTVLSVAPEFGWKMDANWDLGIAANFGYDQTYLPTNFGVSGDAYAYGVGAFARYKVAQFGGVKLLLKGSVGVDFVTGDPDGADSETLTTLNADIIPMITYDISESFTLYANLNFLGVHAGYVFENDDLGIDDSWAINAFANADNVANTGNFQIGFTYNF